MKSTIVVGAALAATAALVMAAEIQHARAREYLPLDPGYDVDVVAGSESPGEALEVAILGDSLVAGLGADSARDSLGGHLASQLARKLGRPVHVVGYGVSGAVTADVLDHQLDKVEKGVDVIVIEVGSNDVTHLTSLGSVEHDTRDMLLTAQKLAPVVVLGSAGKMDTHNFLRPLRDVVVWRATRVRERQRRAADRAGAAFMDVAKEVSPEFERAAPKSSSSDDFHPSSLGYEIWAKPLVRLVATGLARQHQAAR